MLITILLILFFYTGYRIFLIYTYVFKINIDVYLELGNNFNPSLPEHTQVMTKGQLDFEKMDKAIAESLSSDAQENWIKIYEKDKKIKSSGTFIISVLSIATVIFNLDSVRDNMSSIVLVALPSILQFINEVISWFEIDEPTFAYPMRPVRYKLKKLIKKQQKPSHTR